MKKFVIQVMDQLKELGGDEQSLLDLCVNYYLVIMRFERVVKLYSTTPTSNLFVIRFIFANQVIIYGLFLWELICLVILYNPMYYFLLFY